MRRLGAAGLTGLALIAAPAAMASDATRIESPRAAGKVVRHGHVRIVVRSRATHLRILVDGRGVTRRFRRSGGAYRATLRLGHGVHPGLNELSVVTGAYTELDRTSFVVARRNPGLLRLGTPAVGGREAPVRVVATTARRATLRAWVNGHRVDDAFRRQGRRRHVGRLGANDFLRAGRNRLAVLAYESGRRSAAYDARTRTFTLGRRLTAGAGRDRVITAGHLAVLRGSASGRKAISYRWTIAGRSHGATLTHRHGAAPRFLATAPGVYRIRVTARGEGGAVSVDTASVAVRADVPPMGWRLETSDDRGTITLDGVPVPNTTCADPPFRPCRSSEFATYAIFDRQTLQRITSGLIMRDNSANWLHPIAELASRYDRSPTYLMVVNIANVVGISDAMTSLYTTLGVGNLSPPPLHRRRSISIVGVPGARPAGSAFMSSPIPRTDSVTVPLSGASMSGYLRLNPDSATGDFEFVRTDQREFDTDAGDTADQVTIKVGDRDYTQAVPADGSSGFFLVVLNSHTLALDRRGVFVTNNPDRSERPSVTREMAYNLEAAYQGVARDGQELVLMQSFGRPRGLDGAWLAAGAAIERLGGNEQVFVQLNQGNPDEPHQGRYAFAGRTHMGARAAESSQSLTGRDTDGRLHGLLGRARDNQYMPLMANATGTINFDLLNIVNQPSRPDGGFPALGLPGRASEGAAAAAFLARDRDVMGVCVAAPGPCDVRRAYYERYAGVNWVNILVRLGGELARERCAQPHVNFTVDDCNAVRRQLEVEIGRRNAVETYFGPHGLQAPFSIAGAPAIVDIAAIAGPIFDAVQPPPADTSVSDAMNVVSGLLGVVGAVGGRLDPKVGAAAGGLSAAFAVAGYLTQPSGRPDLIGPQVRAAASQLGVELLDRYQRVSAYFTTEAKIVMSDYEKMSEVAAHAASDPRWVLGDATASAATIRQGTVQAIHQSLFPVAYPILYDLGTNITDGSRWYCNGGSIFYPDQRLFQRVQAGGQVSWRMTHPHHFGRTHLLVVGGRRTVGSGGDAYVPAPPQNLTDPLFRDPRAQPSGGVGLYRLEFYSPRYFTRFHQVLQQGSRGFEWCTTFPNPPGRG